MKRSRKISLLVNNDPGPNLDGLSNLKKLFSPDFYLSAYPDVANAEIHPWVHFSKNGIFEGRSPNPYIDPRFMATMLGLPLREVLIEAFSKKEYWIVNTSPYVDIQNFVLNGPWNGSIHPLEQIISEDLNREPWVRFAPSFSDLATVDEKDQRLAAVSILEHVNGKKFQFSRPVEYLLDEGLEDGLVFEKQVVVRCIPGHSLSTQGVSFSLSTNSEVLAPDKSALRTHGKITLYEYGEAFHCKKIYIAPKNLVYKEAIRWVRRVDSNSVLVPNSADQKYLLEYCIQFAKRVDVQVIEHGVQSEITCSQVVYMSEKPKEGRRVFRSPERMRRASLVVVAESHAELLRDREKVSLLVKRGAAICIANNQTVPLFLKALSRKRVLILCGNYTWPELWVKSSVPFLGVNEW